MRLPAGRSLLVGPPLGECQRHGNTDLRRVPARDDCRLQRASAPYISPDSTWNAYRMELGPHSKNVGATKCRLGLIGMVQVQLQRNAGRVSLLGNLPCCMRTSLAPKRRQPRCHYSMPVVRGDIPCIRQAQAWCCHNSHRASQECARAA